ncbi:MAG: hypothetical protein KDD53_07665 [Bdellovibrionales bacterium]|nr:hypothetical protein [Bdellovibrionales bacterium]
MAAKDPERLEYPPAFYVCLTQGNKYQMHGRASEIFIFALGVFSGDAGCEKPGEKKIQKNIKIAFVTLLYANLQEDYREKDRTI